MSKAGHEVIILNRDIKFGGLAEYGIFPSKLKLRGGLRKTYWEVVERPNVHYFGNVSIGQAKGADRGRPPALGASAVVFATGAQGTKTIGVEGDSAAGVFHAKDVVYHFNRLPGFGDRPFDMGKHVAVIGVGDVMVDIAHWLTRYKQVERVTAIARRGPLERKYNPKEIRAVCANIDHEAYGGICPNPARLEAVGQEPDKIFKGHDGGIYQVRDHGKRHQDGVSVSGVTAACSDRWHNRVRALELEETSSSRRDKTRRRLDSNSIMNSLAIVSCLRSGIESTTRWGFRIRTACS